MVLLYQKHYQFPPPANGSIFILQSNFQPMPQSTRGCAPPPKKKKEEEMNEKGNIVSTVYNSIYWCIRVRYKGDGRSEERRWFKWGVGRIRVKQLLHYTQHYVCLRLFPFRPIPPLWISFLPRPSGRKEKMRLEKKAGMCVGAGGQFSVLCSLALALCEWDQIPFDSQTTPQNSGN